MRACKDVIGEVFRLWKDEIVKCVQDSIERNELENKVRGKKEIIIHNQLFFLFFFFFLICGIKKKGDQNMCVRIGSKD